MADVSEPVRVQVEGVRARLAPEHLEWFAETLAETAAEAAEQRGVRLVGPPSWWVEFSSEMASMNERRLVYESSTEPVDG